jgi:hypothetical protein
MEDDDFEIGGIEDFEQQENIKRLKHEHQITGFLLLFKHWSAYGKDAPRRIYLYFKENHNLHQMLNEFEKMEEYEKCAVIRDWLNEIQFLEKNDCVNSSKLNL